MPATTPQRKCQCGRSLNGIPKEVTLCFVCVKKDKFVPGSGEFTHCYNCGNAYQRSFRACPDCNYVQSTQQAATAVLRANKGYEDIVAENARKAGKNAEHEVKAARSTNAMGYLSDFDSREVNQKLAAFIRRTGGQSTGWAFPKGRRPRGEPRTCMNCHSEFLPFIGRQIFCSKRQCQKARLKHYYETHPEVVQKAYQKQLAKNWKGVRSRRTK